MMYFNKLREFFNQNSFLRIEDYLVSIYSQIFMAKNFKTKLLTQFVTVDKK